MAKQSGIHQLRGKVGEHSYYRQTGVSTGLVRSINQGMSARVKNDPAFANTRRNNTEFAGACDVAHLLGQMVTPKYRPMILPFSQSNMSKKVLEIAKVTNAIWGQRVVPADSAAQLADILTQQSKLAVSDIISLSLPASGTNQFELTCSWSDDQATSMAGLGINGIVINISVYNLATGKFNALTASIRKGYRELVTTDSSDEDIVAGSGGNSTFSPSIPDFAVDSKGWNGHQIVIVVVLPYRVVNDVKYTLQEYCRFAALPVVRTE